MTFSLDHQKLEKQAMDLIFQSQGTRKSDFGYVCTQVC